MTLFAAEAHQHIDNCCEKKRKKNFGKVIKMYSLVNVPMTLPSSLLATESHSWAAMSAATFFAKRCKEKKKRKE